MDLVGVVMRMRVFYSKKLAAVLFLTMFLVTASYIPDVFLNRNNDQLLQSNSSSPQNEIGMLAPEKDLQPHSSDFSVAESNSVSEGVMNPVTVEQSGYAASENLSARTDTYDNLAYDLPLDTAHEWKADEAEVSVWNLEKLYAVNGTFDEGYPGYTVNPNGTLDYYPLGWSADSFSGNMDQAQQVSYQQGGDQFISVQNAADLTNFGKNEYTHFEGTNVTWFQTFENAPYTDQFLLQYNYLLLQGPLSSLFSGNYSLKVFIDDEVVSTIDLPTLSNRGTWFDSGSIPVTIAAPSEFMTLRIGIVINAEFVVSADDDYDEDGSPDGAINTQFITVYLDDVSLIKATPPTPDQVQLQFATSGQISPLTGSLGLYTASITNASYWTASIVSVSVSSNTSVSFDYKTRLLSHRYTDSNWETNIESTGVSYIAEHGNSSELALFAYVGYLGNYEDPQMEIVFPNDWENVTVSDPFLTLQTGECVISEGHLTVPSSLIIAYLGWWEVRFDSPNYAKSIIIQKETTPSVWIDDTIYRVGNTTRTKVTIGTTIDTPTSVDNVNITWSLPNGSEWTTESLSGGVAGLVTGTSHVLTSSLSPAGEWCAEILWSNGTEIAYDVAFFEVHHTANLIGEPEVIETDAGLVVTGIVRYTDDDTGMYIMDDLATISCNWSLSTVYFDANSVKNWWEVSLDTEDIGAGTFIVQVDASRPYYDDVSCEILILSTNITRLNSPNAPWSSAEGGSEISLIFNFEVYDSGTDTWGPVVNNSDVSVDINWTLGYWSVVEDSTPGIYLVSLDTSAKPSGTYLLVTTFEKPFHESQQLLLTLIVSPIASSLVVPGGNSFEIGLTDVFNTTFTYKTFDDIGIESADISILYSGISGGLSWNLVEKSLGDYNVEFSATTSGTYVVTIIAFEQYHQSASDSFFLVVRDISTNFTSFNGTAGIVSFGNDYRLVMSYTNGSDFGLTGANISIESVVPETGLSWSTTIPGGPGNYSIVLTPQTPDTFTILLKASLLNHQVQFVRFTITATAIASSLTVLNTSTTIAFDQEYTVYVRYQGEGSIGLENANLSIQNPPSTIGFTAFEDIGDGYYRVTLAPLEIGTFDIIFRAELTGYQSDSAGFVLGASRIQTELQLAGGLSSDSISYLQTSELIITYERTDFNLNIAGAEISIQMIPSIGLNWSYYEDSGIYYLQLEPSVVGRWTLTISASKLGYSVGSVQFILDVEPVSVEVELLTVPSNVEGVEFPIEIALTIEGTDTPVEGALVEFRLTVSGNPVGSYETMEETDSPGVYRIMYTFPLYLSTTDYELEIQVSKDNYELTGGPFTSLFSKTDDVVLRMIPIATGSGLLIVLIVGSVIGYRVNNTRKRRRNLEAHQVKKRFDDVSNILGIIVLHKTSGLPVYSKILKGGFEEAMVSAFITAITHFRSEFEMDEKHWEFNVIPISDIISAVPTRSLIVAFITVHSPSKFQEVGMEAFGRATGAMFDELLADQKSSVEDLEQTKILDTLFYDLLDGFLIERFRTSKDVSFPKSMQCLVDTAQQLENGEGFKLEDLAKGMASCGIEESYAYKIVMDAIDGDLIEMANGDVPDKTENVSALFVDREISAADDEDEFTS